MSQAQLIAHAAVSPTKSISEDEVYAVLRKLGAATAEQVIAHITGERKMTAVEGKRVSQPVYRVLSEGASAGVLDESESVINPDTDQPNTLYRIRAVAGPAKKKEPTWKEKALELQLEVSRLKKELDAQRNFFLNKIERLGGSVDNPA